MDINEKFDKIYELARHDHNLRDRILNTQNAKEPLAAFCKVAQELNIPMDVMEIVSHGEEFYAEIKRNTNGGGENSPDLDFQNDDYSIFISRVKDL